MKHGTKVLLAALALSAVAFGCASGGSQQAGSQAAATVATVGADGIQRIAVVARSFAFSPSRIAVKAGVPVEMTLSKEPDVIPHNFTLEAAAAGISVSESLASTPKLVRFTPTKPGTYEFYCNVSSFKSHRSLGMVGTLEVQP